MSRRPAPFTPLRHRAFRNILVANFVSSLGAMVQGVGAAWLMTRLTNSVELVALVQTAVTLPVMLFAVLGGALADSFDRRRVMLLAQLFMLLASAVLAAMTYLGVIDAWSLLAFTFLIGCGTAVVNPAWHASVGDLVPRDDIPAAVGLHGVGFNLSRSLGPAVGGAIVAVAGVAAAFLVNTLSFFAVLAALLTWRSVPAPSRVPREHLLDAIGSGLRYVAMSPPMLTILLRSSLFGATGVAVVALLPSLADQLLGGDALTYGLLLGTYGAGAVAAATLSSSIRQRFTPETIIRAAFLAFAACALLNATGWIWTTALGLVLGGASWVFGQTLFNVSVQLGTARWVVGRALSIYQTGVFGGMAVGSWLWGLAADQLGLQQTLVIAALTMLAGALLGLLLPLPLTSAEDLGANDAWQEPRTALELEQGSGPIHVEVIYQIREADQEAFLKVMAERGRIRRRDGAQHWHLLRDLHAPERWIERYRTPRWVDYIRHNLRRTRADSAVHERLQALHAGPGAPVVNRYLERPTIW